MSRINLDESTLTNPYIRSGLKQGITILTDAANTALDLDMGPVLYMATTVTGRTLTLPAMTAADFVTFRGLTFTVINGGAFTLIFRTSTPTNIATIPATIGATGTFVCLGNSALGIGGWAGGL
jgi:hypothetical protein